MPFPTDEEIMKTGAALVAQLQELFGKHPGFRPAHAKGILLKGAFTPTEKAASLSVAPHFNSPSTPLTIRFSNSTGIPNIPDTDPNADPRGIAIRFNLPVNPTTGHRQHTDIIAHSTPFFPTRTGEKFLEFLQAVAASPPGTPSPSPVEKVVGANPSILAFVSAPKPAPSSFAREQFWSVTAFKLIDTSGKETYIRYHVVPELGVDTLSTDELATKDTDYLFTDIKERVKTSGGAGGVKFKLLAQLAGEGDVTDDATVHWPDDREVVELGTIKIESLVEDSDKEQKYDIFDPIPRVKGVEPSADPLLEMRAAVYLISGKQRRAA
ncbi:hypothetical protein B7463_g4021, partial [Scytalidium lignicola]